MKRIDSATEVRNGAAPRQAAALEESLHRSLASYAMAAGAAGVGVMALAQPAAADIIYTPVNISVDASQGLGQLWFFPISLNGRPATFSNPPQLTFSAWGGHGVGCVTHPGANCVFGSYIRVSPAGGNALAVGPLNRGDGIGPSRQFGGPAVLASHHFGTRVVSSGPGRSFFSSSSGPWAPNKSGYLGVRFLINGETHYGWVALSVSGGTGDVTGYAYETTANESIRAGQTSEIPEPATLGLLALGSLGLGLWRRRKAETANRE